MKKNKILYLIIAMMLAFATFVGATGCAPTENPNTSTSAGSGNGETKTDFTITFHYGIASGATLDADGKASEYTDTEVKTSYKGNKVNLTSSSTKKFEEDGYKVIGYSTEAWKKNGITADMDVYVLYAELQELTVTFQNPDGSVIKTLTKEENSVLEDSEYPLETEIMIESGSSFLGWDGIPEDGVITSSIVIKAMQGTEKVYEAETAQRRYYIGEASSDTAKMTPDIYGAGNAASGGSYVYIFDNNSAKRNVGIEFDFYAEEDITLVLKVSVGKWDARSPWNIAGVLSCSLKSGEGEFENVPISGEGEVHGESGKWNAVGTLTEVARVNFKQGNNTLRFTGSGALQVNFDCISLSGDMSRITLPRRTLTLGDGATFADGTSAGILIEGGKLPTDLIINVPQGKYHYGWTDGENNYTLTNFRMPTKDVTLTPIFVEGKQVSITAGDAQARGTNTAKSGSGIQMYAGNNQSVADGAWVEMSFTTYAAMEVDLSLKAALMWATAGNYPILSMYNVYIKSADGEYEKITADTTGTLYKNVVNEAYEGKGTWTEQVKKLCTLDLGVGTYTIKVETNEPDYNKASTLLNFTFDGVVGELALMAPPAEPMASVDIAAATGITVDGTKDAGYTKAGDLLTDSKIAGNQDDLDAEIYMAYDAGNLYVYVEVTDGAVVTRGKDSRVEGFTNLFANDQIEFWWKDGDDIHKVSIDAFGYGIMSLDDGKATSINVSGISYATKLIGANLADFKNDTATVATGATGYAVEFCLPISSTSVAGTSLNWTIQVNSIATTNMGSYTCYGAQMKTQADLARVDHIYTADFIAE